jgi:hypothetical protein
MSPPEYPLRWGGELVGEAGVGDGLSSPAPPISRSQGGCHHAGGKGESCHFLPGGDGGPASSRLQARAPPFTPPIWQNWVFPGRNVETVLSYSGS